MQNKDEEILMRSKLPTPRKESIIYKNEQGYDVFKHKSKILKDFSLAMKLKAQLAFK